MLGFVEGAVRIQDLFFFFLQMTKNYFCGVINCWTELCNEIPKELQV